MSKSEMIYGGAWWHVVVAVVAVGALVAATGNPAFINGLAL